MQIRSTRDQSSIFTTIYQSSSSNLCQATRCNRHRLHTSRQPLTTFYNGPQAWEEPPSTDARARTPRPTVAARRTARAWSNTCTPGGSVTCPRSGMEPLLTDNFKGIGWGAAIPSRSLWSGMCSVTSRRSCPSVGRWRAWTLRRTAGQV